MAKKDVTQRIGNADNLPYITAREAADKWGISLRRVSKLCQDGRVKGAFKMARIWLIPQDLEKPVDVRYNVNKYYADEVDLGND